MTRMRKSNVQFFATREECMNFIRLVRNDLGMHVVQMHYHPFRAELWDGSTFPDNVAEYRFFDYKPVCGEYELSSRFLDANPNSVSIRLPTIKDGLLQDTSMGGIVYTDEAYKKMQQIIKMLKKNMTCGVYMEIKPGVKEFAKIYWITEGVKKFLRNGGRASAYGSDISTSD